MLNPRNYPEDTAGVVHIETHTAHVFLCDKFVYKVKKAVNFGFLDFSTLRKRHYYCEKEVSLNSRLAGETYLGVIPIFGGSNGNYSFLPTRGSRIKEYAVKMKILPEGCILFNLIKEGRPLHRELPSAAALLAAFHLRCPAYRGRVYGGIDTIIAATEENFRQILPFVGSLIDEPVYRDLMEYTRSFIDANSIGFASRRRDGWIRDGHGDLHSQHVCLTTPPVIFDCIEFNEKFRIIDVLEDIAFLFMDLEFRGRFDLSTSLCNSYFNASAQCRNDDLLRFYKVYRAVVRGKVEGLLARNADDEATKAEGRLMAMQYFHLAQYYITDATRPFNPVIFMGLSGSGKSTVARDLADGWTVLHSDEVRKSMVGLGKTEHSYTDYGEGIYNESVTSAVYSRLLETTVSEALRGRKMAVDATFLKSSQRIDFYGVCRSKGLNPFFVHLFAEEGILRERIEKRVREGADASDAQVKTLERQLTEAEEPIELPFYRVLRLNTQAEFHTILDSLKEFL